MKHDYKVVGGQLSFRRKRRRHLLVPLLMLTGGAAAVAGGLVSLGESPDPGASGAIAIALPAGQRTPSEPSLPAPPAVRDAPAAQGSGADPGPLPGGAGAPEAADAAGAARAPEPDPAVSREELVVRPGDSLVRIFKRAGAGTAGLYRLLDDREVERRLARIHPGQRVALELDAEGALVAFAWHEDERTVFQARRDGEGFATETVVREPPPPEARQPAQGMQARTPGGDAQAAPAPLQEPRLAQTVVRSGDTLSGIFDRHGLHQEDLIRLLANKETKRRLSQLHPGQNLVFELDGEDRLQRMIWSINPLESLEIRREGDRFATALVETQLESRIAIAAGEVASSLFEAGLEAGLSDNVIMQMTDILAWDIDFALDIRRGDQFSVIYEELYDQAGKKVKDGRIVAVDFINRGRVVTALRYTDPAGQTDYYSPDGHSMRKAFLRTPVKFSRISSRFSLSRRHPILNTTRAHRGVDYAAPTGTPVKATGDGKVIYRGWKGGYGKTVVLQHGGRYTTLYAHLNGYARGLDVGQRVRQGQHIGYIGSTGLSTGPHLHYEFRVDGVHRDPLKVELPEASPLPRKYLADFRAATGQYLAELERLRHTQVALNESP
jgi:murein DD-endopeptidase MepM/ murein hydrolase activator NlpD